MLDALPKGKFCAEIGVQTGEFAAEIMERLAPALLYLIDPYEYQPEGYDDSANQSQTQHHEARASARERFREFPKAIFDERHSFAAADRRKHGTFGFVYIDANHAFANVLIDMAQWWLLVERDGFLAGHDYVNATHPEVHRAVNEFCRIIGVDLYGVTNENDGVGPTSWIIQKP